MGYKKDEVEYNEIVDLMSREVVSMLDTPSDSVSEGGELHMRRQIAKDWGDVLQT